MLKKSFLSILIIAISVFYANAQMLRYSSDGKMLGANWIVTYGGYNRVNQILFFDTASGKVKTSSNIDENNLEKPIISFAPGNQGLLIGDQNSIVTLKLTADNKNELEDFNSGYGSYDKKLIAVAPTSDGKTIYKVFADQLIAYNFLTKKVITESGKELTVKESGSRNEFIGIDNNGRFLVEYEKKGRIHSLIIHNLLTKKAEKLELPYGYEGDLEATFSARISQNGERLALKCQLENDQAQITVWNLKSGLSLGAFSTDSVENVVDFYPIENFAFSPDGKKVALKLHNKLDENVNNLLFLWDVDTKKETLTEAKKYSEELFANDFTFSPDSKQLAISSQILLPNSLSMKIQILDANTGSFMREF